MSKYDAKFYVDRKIFKGKDSKKENERAVKGTVKVEGTVKDSS